MKVNLDTIIFYVKEIQLLKEFYTENFDLKVIEENDIWILLNAGNINIGFHRIGDKFLEKLSADHKFDNNTKIVFEIEENLELLRDELLAKNITMRELKTFEDYDFWLCDGIDPEGNVFQLKSRKFVKSAISPNFNTR